jgi:hypothetical protein
MGVLTSHQRRSRNHTGVYALGSFANPDFLKKLWSAFGFVTGTFHQRVQSMLTILDSWMFTFRGRSGRDEHDQRRTSHFVPSTSQFQITNLPFTLTMVSVTVTYPPLYFSSSGTLKHRFSSGCVV